MMGRSLLLASRNIGTPDPHFSNVLLLLKGDGSNGSTTIIDSGPSARTVTALGGAQISTAQSRFGGSSIAFNGADGTYLSIPDSSDFTYGANNFTVEAHIYLTASQFQPIIAGQWDGVGGGTGLSWVLLTSNNDSRLLRFLISINGSGVVGDFISSSAIPLNTWRHVALVRNGNVFTAYHHGIGVISYTAPSNISLFDANNPITIGASSNGGFEPDGSAFPGHMDEIRITRNIARYTADFTPPTEPFPDF